MTNDNRTVLKIKTSYYSNKRSSFIKKEITLLKRKSYGYDLLNDEIGHIGDEDVLSKIINIDKVSDGIYELIICNESYDFETGNLEDYDYRLVKYNDLF